MADAAESAEGSKPKASGKNSMLMVAVLGLIALGAGFASPFFFLRGESSAQESAGHGEDEHASTPSLIPFDEVVVNLNESRLNRYLRIKLSLVVGEGQVETLAAQIEQRKSVLKSWLLSHLADKALDDIRGAAGQNRLRREIQEYFNSVLSAAEGERPVENVLFEEFNIQ